jgi:DNA repair protein RadC
MKTYKSNIDQYFLRKEKADLKRVQVTNSEIAYKYIKEFYFNDIEIYESFFILIVNRANTTIGFAKISQGGTAGTVIDVKIIAKYCIEGLAHGVILAHNHPSGNIKPSEQDKQITSTTKNALSLFDIKVLDHIILTEDNYFSFSDEGLI